MRGSHLLGRVSAGPGVARCSDAPFTSNDGMADASLRFAPWKNDLSGVDLTMAAAAGAIRTPVNIVSIAS
jgi:hypothetical protein